MKVKGNRTYSKAVCKFVTIGENCLDAVARKMEKRWIKKQQNRKPAYEVPCSVQW